MWSSNAVVKKQVENTRKRFSPDKDNWVELLAAAVSLKTNK